MKRGLFISIVSFTFCTFLTGCMRTDVPTDTSSGTKTEAETQELVWEDSHVSGELKENLILDANIPKTVPATAGSYRISGKKDNGFEELFEQCVDTLYGADVTTTRKDAPNIDTDINTSVDETAADYSPKGVDYDYYLGDLLEVFHPDYDHNDYDKEVIDASVNRFLEVFADIIPANITRQYTVMHFNQAFYEHMEQYGEGTMSNWQHMDEDYYLVRFYTEPEENIFYKSRPELTFAAIPGEKVENELTTLMEGIHYFFGTVQRIDLLIYPDGQIFGIQMDNNMEIGEKIREEAILGVEDVIELLRKKYEKRTLLKSITISDIELQYQCFMADELDESGNRELFLAPVWVVKYLEEGQSVFYTYIFSATTGELLFSSV